MLCENCKERPASVIFKQESDEGAAERHLCDKCAFQSQMFQFADNEEPLSIQQFLSHWLGGSESFQPSFYPRGSMPEGPACPDCQLTFSRFLEIGKFGCSTCYDTFRDKLPRVLSKLHNGHTGHTGKVPMSFNELFAIKKKIEEIRLNMQDAIAQERFEEAARLRDEAKALRQRAVEARGKGDESDVD